MSERPRFHLAFPVHDLEAARAFYVGVMGARVGRESARWIDFDFFGHQITAHLSPSTGHGSTNPVDGDDVPVRHFGAVLEWSDWESIAERLRASKVRFLIEPHVRFAGEVGEQATLFLVDPSDNAIELKAFRRPEDVFSR